MSWRESEDHARETGPTQRLLRGMIRRVAITLVRAGRVVWQVTGQRGGVGGDEVFDVEPFGVIGHFARPPAGGRPEAIVVMVGGSKSPALIAARDEKTRKLIDAHVGDGETAIYNGQSLVVVKQDGTIELRSIAGSAGRVATLADIEALTEYIDRQFQNTAGHTHAVAGAATTTIITSAGVGFAPTTPAPTPAGTQKVSLE